MCPVIDGGLHALGCPSGRAVGDFADGIGSFFVLTTPQTQCRRRVPGRGRSM